jgi:hypothetical protein
MNETNRIEGGTYTRRALEESWRDMWEPNLDSNRGQTLLLVTDGVPSTGQSPCDIIEDKYKDSGKFLYERL